MATSAALAKGTRDFFGDELLKRSYLIGVIEQAFKNFGFSQIQTPSFENIETLMGKYGDEGDRLIFKILKSGDYLSKVPDNVITQSNAHELTKFIADKALRYDLTVPFARFVVQHQNELALPFKRYQIQPVWRADRPQKGRFREFYQCDADIVGAVSLWQEVDLVQLYDTVFDALGLHANKPTLRFNHRKILSGIAESFGIADELIPFTVALDKLDKIGAEGVLKELESLSFTSQVIDQVGEFLRLGNNLDKQLDYLQKLFINSSIGLEGVADVRFLLDKLSKVELSSLQVVLDLTLARGLNYYTGLIFEVSAPKGVELGSIGGGGRYDNLTTHFGGTPMGGVGISFGLDRIYMVLEMLDLFPVEVSDKLDIVVLFYEDSQADAVILLIAQLRKQGVSIEMYPGEAKLQKQFKYIDKRKARFALYPKPELIAQGKIELKDLENGEVTQFELSHVDQIKKALQ